MDNNMIIMMAIMGVIILVQFGVIIFLIARASEYYSNAELYYDKYFELTNKIIPDEIDNRLNAIEDYMKCITEDYISCIIEKYLKERNEDDEFDPDERI